VVNGRSVDPAFWRGRRVFLTGHTGFKGSWLSIWLHRLEARVTGYALAPPTEPSLFALAGVGSLVRSVVADVRDAGALRRAVADAAPEVVFHLAAQPSVRASYRDPASTYAVNLLGTVHLLDAVRACPGVRAVVNVTTDKCYENREWVWGYRENEPMGGYDPYSGSKACSELATSTYRSSFFNPADPAAHGAAVATARAGNVVGGGDWAEDRLVPDAVKALLEGKPVPVRNPHAIRPWQHVLDPLHGYLLLAERLVGEGAAFAEGWNFGPDDESAIPVADLVGRLCRAWGRDPGIGSQPGDHPHEAGFLKLDSSKARSRIGWRPRWGIDRTVMQIGGWYSAVHAGRPAADVCREQIEAYLGRAGRGGSAPA
jgi:CDP-glucose 4,6-dehydratase